MGRGRRQNQKLPSLELPESSCDLPLDCELLMTALAIYEVLREFHGAISLSPFRFEDFCQAVSSNEMTPLLSEMHIQLLKAILSQDEVNGIKFCPEECKNSVNNLFLTVDALTWPEVLRLYLQSDSSFCSAYKVITSCVYPYGTSPKHKLQILELLTDQFVCENSFIREQLCRRANIKRDSLYCYVCDKPATDADIGCCKICSAVCHLSCMKHAVQEEYVEGDWCCEECAKHMLDGMLETKKTSHLTRLVPLGTDRQGRRYWFMVRRVIVEGNRGDVRYYSSSYKYDQLLHVLEANGCEQKLFGTLSCYSTLITTCMLVTERLTEKFAGDRINYFDIEHDALNTTEYKSQDCSDVGECDEKMDVKGQKERIRNGDKTDTRSMSELLKEVGEIGKVFILGDEDEGCKQYVNRYATQHNHNYYSDAALTCGKFDVCSFPGWSGHGGDGCSVYGDVEAGAGAVRRGLLELVQRAGEGGSDWCECLLLTTCTIDHIRRALLCLEGRLNPRGLLPAWNKSKAYPTLRRTPPSSMQNMEKSSARKKRHPLKRNGSVKDEDKDCGPLIKYSRFPSGRPPHEIYKQGGEKYRRFVACHGWMWVSRGRRAHKRDPGCSQVTAAAAGDVDGVVRPHAAAVEDRSTLRPLLGTRKYAQHVANADYVGRVAPVVWDTAHYLLARCTADPLLAHAAATAQCHLTATQPDIEPQLMARVNQNYELQSNRAAGSHSQATTSTSSPVLEALHGLATALLPVAGTDTSQPYVLKVSTSALRRHRQPGSGQRVCRRDNVFSTSLSRAERRRASRGGGGAPAGWYWQSAHDTPLPYLGTLWRCRTRQAASYPALALQVRVLWAALATDDSSCGDPEDKQTTSTPGTRRGSDGNLSGMDDISEQTRVARGGEEVPDVDQPSEGDEGEVMAVADISN